jgi:uncharacterized protein
MDLDFPYHVDGRGRSALTTEEDHVRDMIEQFLFTSHGERVNRPDYGSGILQLVFDPGGPEVAAALRVTIQAGLARWLADLIEVERLEVSADDATMRVFVGYRLRRNNEQRVAEITRPVSP